MPSALSGRRRLVLGLIQFLALGEGFVFFVPFFADETAQEGGKNLHRVARGQGALLALAPPIAPETGDVRDGGQV